MILKDLIDEIEKQYPKDMACEWDHVGLEAGFSDSEIGAVYVTLDATSEAIEEAKRLGANLIVAHHPMIFDPIYYASDADFVGKRVWELAKAGIALYVMHTNFDRTAMAVTAAALLGLSDPAAIDEEGLGYCGETKCPDIRSFAENVKEVFALPHVRVYGDPDMKIRAAAVVPGSGKSMVEEAIASGADVLVTGDIDHHSGIDALEKGIALIDAGHYGIEHIFVEYMAGELRKMFLGLQVYTRGFGLPYTVI